MNDFLAAKSCTSTMHDSAGGFSGLIERLPIASFFSPAGQTFDEQIPDQDQGQPDRHMHGESNKGVGGADVVTIGYPIVLPAFCGGDEGKMKPLAMNAGNPIKPCRPETSSLQSKS